MNEGFRLKGDRIFGLDWGGKNLVSMEHWAENT